MRIIEVDVAIIGGGPFGLTLANELGRRGLSASLFDEKPSTAFNPQANATQARTMEHFRRLGFSEEIRSLGLPEEFPTDIAYFTRYGTYELARYSLPSAREARRRIRGLSGSWSAAELPHRVSQKFVEAVLRRHAERLPGISVKFGWRLTRFEDKGDHILAFVEDTAGQDAATVRARYMIGGDGSRSTVRRQLGIHYSGDTGVVRDFMGGRMHAIYLRCPSYYERVPHQPAWMNCAVNPERRAFMVAVDGKGEFAFHTQLRDNEDETRIGDADALAMFQAAVGLPIQAEILSRSAWTAGYTLVAERYGEGRIFMGGDAVHLFTPTGGLGYNTAVEDAVNLGWKLAAAVRGRAGPRLLDSYEVERRPIALRNTSFARDFADSLGGFVPKPEIEDDTPAGRIARDEARQYYEAHGRAEFNIPGITFGGRYDDSPVIISDGAAPPRDVPNEYTPTAVPGGRPPHLWLESGVSLFDKFGFDWTLLRIGKDAPAAQALQHAAAGAGLDLTLVDLPSDEARAAYEAPLALIRPDHIVAWRGHDDERAENVIARVLGRSDPGRRIEMIASETMKAKRK